MKAYTVNDDEPRGGQKTKQNKSKRLKRKEKR